MKEVTNPNIRIYSTTNRKYSVISIRANQKFRLKISCGRHKNNIIII